MKATAGAQITPISTAIHADFPRSTMDATADQSLSHRIIGCFYDVYNELGFGFLESVYSRAMEIALRDAGFEVRREAPVDVYFRGAEVGHHRVDLLVDGQVVLENKSGRALAPEAHQQLLHYLRATNLELGLLLYFGPAPRVHRLISTRRDPKKQQYLR